MNSCSERFRASLSCTALVLAFALAAQTHATTTISSLGSNFFEVEASISSGPYSQTSSAIVYTNTFVLADTVGGAFGSFASPLIFDLSSYPSFGLNMALTGGDTYSSIFSVEFFGFDSSAASFYSLGPALLGDTTGISTNGGIFWLQVAPVDPLEPEAPATLFSSLTNVAGLQFSWGGSPVSTNTVPVLLSTTISSLVGAKAEGYFVASSPGGFRFITSSATNGATLPAGESSWFALSDSHTKTAVAAIDHRATLRKVAALPVTAWEYKHDPNRSHVGPMAQDFHATFGLGFDDKHISTLDTDGVTLSAIKGLIEELRERKARSAAQAKRLADLETRFRALADQLRGALPPSP